MSDRTRDVAADNRPRIVIRELSDSDRGRWDELWQGYLEFYKCDLPPAATEILWRRLRDSQDQPYGLVAVQTAAAAANHVVGLVHYHFHLSTWSPAGYCYLEDLYVDPTCRGAGAGRALIEAVYAAADRYGATRVYWHTDNSNDRARTLYDKVGKLVPFVQYRRR